MSVTPTPSASSGQTRYYDALVMQSTGLVNDSTESSSADPHLAVSGNPRDTDQHLHMKGTDSPVQPADDPVEQRTSLRSLSLEPLSGRPTVGETGSASKGSVRRARSTHTNGTPSAFANGAPLMGPNAEPDVDQSLFDRGAKAERALSQKQKNRIAKEEKEDTRKFSKLLKMESSTEKVALDSALKTLSSLQGLHKAAIKRETKAQASHARALSIAQKAESRFQEEKARLAEVRARAEARCVEERARWEGKQGEVRAQQERLEAARETVKETEMRITGCAREVERLRIVKATDEREREAKLTELAGQK